MSAMWWDAIVKHQLRLDGAGAGLAREIIRDLSSALSDLDAEMARLLARDAAFSVGRLAMLRPNLIALRERLIAEFGGSVEDATTAAAETSVEAVRHAMERLGDVALSLGAPADAVEAAISFTAPDLGLLAAVKDQPFDGMNWQRWGERLATDTVSRIESELRQGAALGERLSDVRKRLERVGDLGRTSAEKLARTALNSTGNRARMACYEANSDVIGEVEFLSVLDSRTSLICAGLSGKRWPLNSPDIQHPPRHPNCRSVLVPITKSWAELFGEDAADLPEMPAGEQSSEFGPVPANLTYSDWLKRQPASFQREVLGPSRYEAFAAGVPLTGMASYSRALSIQELRAMYPSVN